MEGRKGKPQLNDSNIKECVRAVPLAWPKERRCAGWRKGAPPDMTFRTGLLAAAEPKPCQRCGTEDQIPSHHHHPCPLIHWLGIRHLLGGNEESCVIKLNACLGESKRQSPLDVKVSLFQVGFQHRSAKGGSK